MATAHMLAHPPKVPVTKQVQPRHIETGRKLEERGWFTESGAYVLVDGQYGSTGKGLCEQVLALLLGHKVDVVTTNAGPNSGHTIYDHITGKKIVTKQVPSFSMTGIDLGISRRPWLYINAGAIIDPAIMRAELELIPNVPVRIHPHAAAILPDHYTERASLGQIASTQKGTGPALADKIMREKFAVVQNRHEFRKYDLRLPDPDWLDSKIFVSTAQGFSLGLHSGFYPHTTCRECTVQQALSDARIPARRLRKVIATYRTFPIRVGNTPAGSSGPCYSDQKELSWAEVGQEPELTTVTGRIRRVFTWSDQQFIESLRVNEPDAIFLNFLNYYKHSYDAAKFSRRIWDLFREVRGQSPDFVMLGFGPLHTDVAVAFSPEEMGKDIVNRMNGMDLDAIEKSGW